MTMVDEFYGSDTIDNTSTTDNAPRYTADATEESAPTLIAPKEQNNHNNSHHVINNGQLDRQSPIRKRTAASQYFKRKCPIVPNNYSTNTPAPANDIIIKTAPLKQNSSIQQTPAASTPQPIPAPPPIILKFQFTANFNTNSNVQS